MIKKYIIKEAVDRIFGVNLWKTAGCRCCKQWRSEVIKLKEELELE